MIIVEEAIRERHSVRQYEDRPIPAEIIQRLKEEIDKVNVKGDLNIQLVTDEAKAFSGGLAHYGKFSGVSNYFVLAGKPGSDLHERCGFYGEHLVLICQRLGLNTCWVGLTFKKIPSAFKLRAGAGFFSKVDLGIAEYHFEAASGKKITGYSL